MRLCDLHEFLVKVEQEETGPAEKLRQLHLSLLTAWKFKRAFHWPHLHLVFTSVLGELVASDKSDLDGI